MKKTLFTLLFLTFLGTNSGFAQQQTVSIYPHVQQLQQQGSPLPFSHFYLTDTSWENLVSRTTVEQWLAPKNSSSWALSLSIQQNVTAYSSPNNTAKAKGAYDLTVSPKKVSIIARDSAGIFYGLQTLRQLIKDQKITPVVIHDFPTVKYRGVVEGFYGTPWSQADRISMLKFYGRVKANTYIYGPKDDPYHSAQWRKPYPQKQAANIKKLVKIARKNFVNFVWAIHPGQDIKWNQKDRENVLKKFEDMYALGVRSFAVFFDDISGAGTDAHKQAALLNYLTKNFVNVKKDVNPLILTPTVYNKSWAKSGPNSYLAILGRELDPSIQIMWTGDHVISNVTRSTLHWVQKLIKRPALIWWNFPVSDYTRDHLLLGPSYGLEKDIKASEMAGILSNPMEHAEASKPAIFGVADYAWNTASYNYKKAWKHSIQVMLPHSYEAYTLFAENNTDPGKTWSWFHRKESVSIAPAIKHFEETMTQQKSDTSDLSTLTNYFNQISKASTIIEKANDNPALTKEIKPWLTAFTYLGQSGLAQLAVYNNRQSARSNWRIITTLIAKKPQLQPLDKKGTVPVVGTKVLQPFLQSLKKVNNQKVLTQILGNSGYRIAQKKRQDSIASHDLNIFSALDLASHKTHTEKSPLSQPHQVILLTQGKATTIQLTFKVDENWEETTQTYSGNYLLIDLPKNTTAVKISSKHPLQLFEVLWKK